MVSVTLPEPTYLAALVHAYYSELDEYMSAIRLTTVEAGWNSEQFVPPEVQREAELAQRCLPILEYAAANPFARTTGVEIDAAHGAVLHASVHLKRDELGRRLRAIRATPLTPPEAESPLTDRIARMDAEIGRVWHLFPTTKVFDLITARVWLRAGGAAWQGLVKWLTDETERIRRSWCFCDTNFFLESRHLFSEVDWPTAWHLPHTVLVVPQAMLRELDDFKADPRRERARRRQRAMKVLQVLDSLAESSAPGTPARLRAGVEVLVLDHDPSPDIPVLDLRLPDDRLLAAAIDFQEHFPGEQVVLVSDDRGPRLKARRFSFERRDLSGQRRVGTTVSEVSSGGASST